MLKKRIQKINKKGFSLVEVLFAMLVLTVGIVGVLVIMMGNIKNSIEAKNQIIAAELVQEGIELVRNLSDNRKLVDGSSYSNFRIDATIAGINFVSADEDWQLFIDGGTYSHTAGTRTNFSRRIDVEDTVLANKQRKITSTVSWNGLGTVPALAENCNVAMHCARASSIISY